MEDPEERKIKRKKNHSDGRKLLVGEKVEVSYFDDGLLGSWHLGEVVEDGLSFRVIKLANLLNEKQSGKLVEVIPVSDAIEGTARTTAKCYRGRIRPFPPHSGFQRSVLRYGLCVEAFVNEAWWEGVIFDHNEGSKKRRVFFPDLGDQSILSIDRLRITQDWDEVCGEWKVRGQWLLLTVIQHFEEQDGLPVSIRQIWYDIRTKPAFQDEVKEWIFGTHDMWFSFVSELLQELWSVIEPNPAANMFPSKELLDVPSPVSDVYLDDLANDSDTKTIYSADLRSSDHPSLLLDCETLKISVLDSSAQQCLGDQTAKDSVQLPHAKTLHSSPHLHGHNNKSLDFSQAITPYYEEYQDMNMHFPGVTDNQLSIVQSAESNLTCTVNKRKLNSHSRAHKSWKPMKIDTKHCLDAQALYSYILEDGKSDIKHSKFSSLSKKDKNVMMRQHLVSLGWQIYWRNYDMSRFRYHSPDGKQYYSLRNVCRVLLEGHEKISQKSGNAVGSEGYNYSGHIMNDLDPVNTNHKPLTVSVQNSTNSPHQSKRHCTKISSSALPRVRMKESLHAEGLEPFDKKVDSTALHDSRNTPVYLSESYNSNISMNDISLCQENIELSDSESEDITPEYLPEAVQEYEESMSVPDKQEYSNPSRTMLSLKAKKHLLYMKWRVVPQGKKIGTKQCYTSPTGRIYHSLTVACKAYLKEHSKSSNLSALARKENSSTLISASDAQAGNPTKKNDLILFNSPNVTTSRMLDIAQSLPRKDEKKSRFSSKLTDYPHHQFSRSQQVDFLKLSKVFNAASNAQAGDPPKQNDMHRSSYISDIPTPPTQYTSLLLPEDERKTQDPLKFSGSYDIEFSRPVPRRPRNSSKRRVKFLQNMFSNSKRKQLKIKEDFGSSSRQVSQSKGSLSRVLRSGKRSRNIKLTSVGRHSAKTVLSWLVERNVLLPRDKVYDRCKTDSQKIKKGQISREGIKCFCCNEFFTIASFDAHAGNKSFHPSASIYLNDGKSLLDCQIQMMNASKHVGSQHRRMKGDYHNHENDEICSICHYGGNIILCDCCPSSFHTNCLGLKDLPEGNWFCPSCKCGICGMSEYKYDMEQFTERTILYCDQCEKEYHVGCLRETRLQSLSNCPTGEWFCSKKCSKLGDVDSSILSNTICISTRREQFYFPVLPKNVRKCYSEFSIRINEICYSLRKLIGRPYPTHVEGLSWTILRWSTNDIIGPDTKAEHHSKLCIALDVMHECFITMIEPYTQSDFVEDVLFNRESELRRLNFSGFYTMLLEKEDELVSVASFRVYDGKAAEMPFIGTRVKFRRQGMCRLLIGELEKLLCGLGVERLLLPAVPQLLETWTTSFGFNKLENSDRLELADYTILNFQDTTMCQKFLNTGRTLSTKYRGLGGKLDDRSRRNEEQNTEISSLGVTEDVEHRTTDLVVDTKQEEMIEAPVLSVFAGIHESTKLDEMPPSSSTETSSLVATVSVEDVSCRGDASHYLPLTSSTDLAIETKQDEIAEAPVLSVLVEIHESTKLDKMPPSSSTEPSSLGVTENVEDVFFRGDASHYLPLTSSTDLAIETKQDEMIEAPVPSILAGFHESTKLDKMSPLKVDMNRVIDLSSKFSGKCYNRSRRR